MSKVMSKVVDVCFKLLMFGILIATIFIDKNLDVRYPNEVRWDNAGYFLIAICILGVIGCFVCRAKELDEKKWKIAIIAIALTTAVIQLIISLWMPTEISTDFKRVREAAIDIAQGGTLAGKSYFKASPNNINITLVLSLVYKIFGNWRAVIFIGSLLTNLSVILMSLSVTRVTKSRWSGIVIAVLGEVLIALTWRAFLPYTDNYGMFFVALAIWLYTSKLQTKIKMPLVIAVGIAGAFIKETVLIILLAIGIHAFIVCLKDKNYKKLLIQTVIAILIVFVGMAASKGVKTITRNHLEYETVATSKGWQFLFMVGQNNEYYGVVNKSDTELRKQMLKDYKDGGLNSAFLKEALGRIKGRGLTGNVKFYLIKLNVAYNDGYFHNMRGFNDKDLKENFLYDLYVDDETTAYAIGADVMQVLWDMVLALLMINAFVLSRKHKSEQDKDTFPQIAILGITMYLMMFEGRAKYLYMLMPVYLYYAGFIMTRFWSFCREVKESGILKVEKN